MTRPGRTTRRRFWFDPRFAIGLALVVASIAGVVYLVAGTDTTTAVYAARAPLAVGDRINASDLVPARVRLGGAAGLYLTPARFPHAGLVATRTIAAGELVPVAAVGTRAGAGVTSIVIDLQGRLPGSIEAGSVVDVWAARRLEQSQFAPPGVLVARASVVRIVPPTGLIAADGAESVEIVVPKEKIAAVLEAIANGDSLAIVPVDTILGK